MATDTDKQPAPGTRDLPPNPNAKPLPPADPVAAQAEQAQFQAAPPSGLVKVRVTDPNGRKPWGTVEGVNRQLMHREVVQLPRVEADDLEAKDFAVKLEDG